MKQSSEYVFRGAVNMKNFETMFKAFNNRKIKRLHILNSTGGDVDVARMAVDLIRTNREPVETVAWGNVVSAASLIFSVGHNRVMMPSATLTIHSTYFDNYNKHVTPYKLISDVELCRKSIDFMVSCYSKNGELFKQHSSLKPLLTHVFGSEFVMCGNECEKINSFGGFPQYPPEDVILTAKEALNFGLCDSIYKNAR